MKTKLLTICLLSITVFFGCSPKEVRKEILNVSCSFKTVVTSNGPLAAKWKLDFRNRRNCNEYNGNLYYSSLPCEVRIQIFQKVDMENTYDVYLDGDLLFETKFRGYGAGDFRNLWIDNNSIKFSFHNLFESKYSYEISRVTGNIKLVASAYTATQEQIEYRKKLLKKIYYENRERRGNRLSHFVSPFDPFTDNAPRILTLEQAREYDDVFQGKCSKNKKNLF